MNQDEFNKLLKESKLPNEFNQIKDQMVRVINDHEERVKVLEARVASLAKRMNDGK